MKLVLFVCLIGVVFALNPKDEAGVNKITKSSGCGNKDLTQPDEIVKNYQIGSRKWANPNISYFLNNVPQNLKRKDLIEQIKKSFDIYAKVSHLNFFEADGPVSVDISIGFYRGEHGDSNPFGPDRNPAHTYPPGSTEISGDIHFNLDITWSIGPTEKPKENLSNHLMREIGYALGLMQSSAQGSIMNPHYFDTLTKNQKTITYLGKDDILGLEKLYDRS